MVSNGSLGGTGGTAAGCATAEQASRAKKREMATNKRMSDRERIEAMEKGDGLFMERTGSSG